MENLAECFFPIALKNIGTWPIILSGIPTYSIFCSSGELVSRKQEEKSINLMKLQNELWVWLVTML